MGNRKHLCPEIRRPLFWAAGFYILFLFLFSAKKIPVTDRMEGHERTSVIDQMEGQQIFLTGTVCQKEHKQMYEKEICVVYLDHLRSAEKTGEDKAYAEKTESKVMCYLSSTEPENKVMCYLASTESEPCMGQRILVSGKLAGFPEATNPGEFNLKEYYQILNISYKVQDAKILAVSNDYSKILENIYQFKCELGVVIDLLFQDESAGIMHAMLLGEKSTLDADIKQLYQLGGIIHILAISGLHISILGMGIYNGMRKCLVPIWMATPVCILFMTGYGVMTGMGISCLRAVFMFSIHVLAGVFGRTYDMLTTLSLIGIWILLQQPLYIMHSGFLLSFGAVVAIGLVVPWFQSLWKVQNIPRRNIHKEKIQKEKNQKENSSKENIYKVSERINRIRSNIIFGVGMMVFTLPILLYFYYSIPIYSFLLNLIVIALMGVLMVDGLVAILISILLIFFQKVSILPILTYMVIPAKVILNLFDWCCNMTIRFPFGILNIGKPEVWQMVLYYSMLGVLLYFYYQKKSIQIPALLQKTALLCAILVLCHKNLTGLSVSFLDVGQGDGIVIVNENGNCYMMDGGSTSKNKVGQYQIIPFLKSRGIIRLEAVLLSHPDEDHVNGVIEMIEQTGKTGIKIGCRVLPDVSQEQKDSELLDLRQLAKEYGIPVRYIGSGDVIWDKRLKIECLNPESQSEGREGEDSQRKVTQSGHRQRKVTQRKATQGGSGQSEDMNEISEVLYLEYGEFSMLLTGDVTGTAEKEVIGKLSGKNLLTVLKVAHHGSKYSTPMELLELAKPQYAIISAGENNRYGHPHEETLKRLEKAGCEVLRTDELGAIILTISHSSEVEWKAYRCSVGLRSK